MRTLALTLLALLAGQAAAQEPVLVIDSGGHTAVIKDVIFTPDGRQLISAGDDKVVRVWDVASGTVARTLRGEIGPGHEGKLYAAALSPDGRLLAVGGYLAGGLPLAASVRLHDFATGEVLGLLAGHENAVSDLAFSPDGRTLASASADHTVRLWRLPGQQAGPVLRGHEDAVYAVAFSPDGQRLASGSYDHTVRLWDVTSGQLVKVLRGHESEVQAVAFSPDGSSLASGSWDRTIRRWGSRNGEDLGVLARQESEVLSLAFSPDGRRLLTGSGVGSAYVSHVFAVPSGREVSRFAHDDIVLGTAFAPDGTLVATAGGNEKGIQLWRPDQATGTPVHRLAGDGRSVWSVAFARDGSSLAFGRTVRFRDLGNYGPLEGTLRLQRDGRFELSLGDAVKDEAAFQRAVAEAGGFRLETPSGGNDPVLRLVRGGETVRQWQRDRTSGSYSYCATFSRDGRRVISGGGSGDLRMYDRDSGATLHELVSHTGDVWAVAASPDGRLLASGSDDQTLSLWDADTGKLLVSVFVGADDEWVAWTPAGYYTASPRGDRYVGWQVNHGVDKAAEYFPVQQFRRQYYRPAVVAKALELRDSELALAEANRLRLTTTPAGPPEAPPEIVVIAPKKDGEVVHDARLVVAVVAVSSGSPIQNLTIALNGRVQNRLEGTPRGNPRQRQEELEVDLQPGENVLTFTAATERAEAVPVTRKVIYPSAAPSSAPRSTLAVLAVGVSDYQDPALRLRFADDDARAVAEVFATQSGRAFSRVVTKVLDGSAPLDRAALFEGLDWLQGQTASPGSVRLLFLAGHGDELRGDYYFLLPAHRSNADPETYNVSWLTLVRRLTDGNATAILIVDTCRAAAITGQRPARADFSETLNEISARATGLITFAAATGTQVSVERPELGHGLYTHSLLRGLRDGCADEDRNGAVEARELGFWLAKEVGTQTGGAQTPYFQPSPGLDNTILFRVTGGPQACP